MQVGSKVVACSPSRFLKELPVQLVRFSFLGPLKKAASFKSSVDNHLRTFLQQFQPDMPTPTASSSTTPVQAAPEPPPPPPSGPVAYEPLTLGDRPISLDHLPLRTGLDGSQGVAPAPEEEEPALSSMEAAAAQVELPEEQHAEVVMLVEAAEPTKPRGRRKKAVVEGEGEDVGSVVAGLLSQAWVAKEDLRPFYLAIVQHVLAQQQQHKQQQDDDSEPPPAPSSSGKRGRKKQQGGEEEEAAIPVPPLVPGKPARSRRVSSCSAEELGLFAVEQAVQGQGPWQAASQALKSVLKKVLQLYGRAVPTKKEGGGSAEELGRRVTEALWDHRRFKAGGSKKKEVVEEEGR